MWPPDRSLPTSAMVYAFHLRKGDVAGVTPSKQTTERGRGSKPGKASQKKNMCWCQWVTGVMHLLQAKYLQLKIESSSRQSILVLSVPIPKTCGVPWPATLSFNGFLRSGCKCLEIKAERLNSCLFLALCVHPIAFQSTAKQKKREIFLSVLVLLGGSVIVFDINSTEQSVRTFQLTEMAWSGAYFTAPLWQSLPCRHTVNFHYSAIKVHLPRSRVTPPVWDNRRELHKVGNLECKRRRLRRWS